MVIMQLYIRNKYEWKYELVKSDSIVVDGHTLYRIRALRDFRDVKAGDLGGYIESESNLSQHGPCWVYDDAKVYERALVFAWAKVFGNASIFGNASVYDHTLIYDNAKVYGNSKIHGKTRVYGAAHVFGNAIVRYDTQIGGHMKVDGDTNLYHYTGVRRIMW